MNKRLEEMFVLLVTIKAVRAQDGVLSLNPFILCPQWGSLPRHHTNNAVEIITRLLVITWQISTLPAYKTRQEQNRGK